MIDLTQIIVAVIGLLGTIMTIYLIPYIKAKTTAADREKAQAWVKIAVEAAEMIYKQSGMGDTKFYYVKKFLEDKGIVLDEQEIKVMIESEVLKLKKEFQA